MTTFTRLCVAVGIWLSVASMHVHAQLDAPVLPVPDPRYQGAVGRTIEDSDPPQFPKQVRPPAGAPNIVLILIDDCGYGQWGTFGGAIPTPTLDKLAKEGLRYTRFHTTALCSPTRAALLTGRNHHSVGTGVITEGATGYDGYTGIIPRSAGTIAQVLHQYGYLTSWFGKNHNTPDWETSQNGPFDRWPNGYGFDYFYGFMGGDADQFQPTLYENHNLVERSTDPEYIMTKDLTNKAIQWLRRTRSIAADQPFFLYMAPGATHAPHHVSSKYLAQFKGMFDEGWDVYREKAFARQKELGVIPPSTKLTPRPAELPAWSSLTNDQRKLYARMMEVFAAFTAETDAEMGRLIDEIKKLPDADNTIILFAVGDNGASAEGGLNGLVNETSFFNGIPESLEDNIKVMNELGGPKHFNHFPAGWAWAMSTPFQWMKQIASHLGGVRNPLVVSWPKVITDKGGVRDQFHHVIDIAPTIYEAIGIQAPRELNGVTQRPLEGVSMKYTFTDKAAKGRHRQQYFEMFVNRGMYQDGWWASSRTIVPWDVASKKIDPDTTKWELYNIDEDYSQANNLAASNPAKLRQLQDLWWAEAARYSVLPLDGRRLERMNAEMQGRPTPTKGRTSFVFFPGSEAVPSGSAPNLLNKSFSITAQIVVPKQTPHGAIFTMGGNDGGYGLYVDDAGKPVFVGNFLGRAHYRAKGSSKLPTGDVTLKAEFTYDGPGMAKGGTLVLYVNGEKVGTATMPATHPITLGLGGALDVGVDTGSGIDEEVYTPPYRFTGVIDHVKIDLMK